MACSPTHLLPALGTVGVPRSQLEGGAALGLKPAQERTAQMAAEYPSAQPSFQPTAEYYDKAVTTITADRLADVPPRYRDTATRLFGVMRSRGIAALAGRKFTDPAEADKAAAALSNVELGHTADVVNLSAFVAKTMGLSDNEQGRLTVAATLHDGGKAGSPFAIHHLTAKRGVRECLRAAGLSLPERDVAEVENAIIRHMAFGKEDTFMRRMLSSYTAGVALQTSGPDRDARLKELFEEALLLKPEESAPIRAFLDAPAAQKMNTNELAEALFKNFSERTLRYPAPNTRLSEALADATKLAGEHINEAERDENGQTMMDRTHEALAQMRRYRSGAFAEALREADTGVLCSASESNVAKYVGITVIASNSLGRVPIVRCMSSWTGGWGAKGTSLDAIESLHLEELRDGGLSEMQLVRETMMEVEEQTFTRWAAAKTEEAAQARVENRRDDATELEAQIDGARKMMEACRRKAQANLTAGFDAYRAGKFAEGRRLLADTDFDALPDFEKVKYEPSLEEVGKIHREHLAANQYRRSPAYAGREQQAAAARRLAEMLA